jgi:hypothetical protein
VKPSYLTAKFFETLYISTRTSTVRSVGTLHFCERHLTSYILLWSKSKNFIRSLQFDIVVHFLSDAPEWYPDFLVQAFHRVVSQHGIVFGVPSAPDGCLIDESVEPWDKCRYSGVEDSYLRVLTVIKQQSHCNSL